MDGLFIAIGGSAAAIIATEWLLWFLFRRKISEMYFPHELDTSFFRFFTMTRMRLLAFIHAAVLILASSGAFLFLW